jgi:antitoxin component YwqK of YwqJK toxin-antitoxin module
MYKFLYALLLLSYLQPATVTLAQNGTTLPGSNRVMLRRADTVIYAYLYEQSKKVKPDLEKYYYWYKSQELKTTHGSYDGRLLDGEYTEYYPNKQLKTKGSFRKGIKSGRWINWNEQGEYQYLCQWKNGRRNGPFREYDEAGKLLRCGNYKDDVLDGCLTEYTADGKPQQKQYRHGAPLPEKKKEEPKDPK